MPVFIHYTVKAALSLFVLIKGGFVQLLHMLQNDCVLWHYLYFMLF